MHCSLFDTRPYQYGPALRVRAFLSAHKDAHASLVYFPLGSGKTLASLAAAREYVVSRPKAKVVVLTTKTNIDTSWRDNVDKFAASEGFRFDQLCVKNVDWWFSEENARLAHYNRLIRLLVLATKTTRRTYLNMTWHQLQHEASRSTHPQLRAMCNVRCATPHQSFMDVCCPKDYFLIVDECQQYVNASAASDLVYRLCRRAGYALLLTATPLNDTRQHAGLCRLLSTRHVERRCLYVAPTPVARVRHRFMASKMTSDEWSRYLHEKSKRDDAYLSRARQCCNTVSKWQRMWKRIRKDVTRGSRRIVVYSFFREQGADGFCDHIKQGGDVECRLLDKTAADLAWFHDPSPWPKLLVITSRAQTGISLMGADAFHVMEPQWSSSDEEQAVGRVTRIGSHRPGQCVAVYHWVAVAPTKQYITADESVLASMRRKKARTDALLQLWAERGTRNLQGLLSTFGICSI